MKSSFLRTCLLSLLTLGGAVALPAATGDKISTNILPGGSANNTTFTRAPEQIAVLTNGNVAVTWQSDDPIAGLDTVDTGSYVEIYNPTTGATVKSAFIPYSDQANTHDQEGPEIAALAGGGFAVGWTIQNGGSSGSEDSYVRVFDNAGTAVSSSTLVTDSAGSSQRQNAMGAIYPLAGGGFIVRVNRDDRDPNPDGAEDDLILQFFNASGAKIGTNILPGGSANNLTFTRAPEQIAELTNGNVAVTWQSDDPIAGLDTVDTGSYVEIYNPTTGATVKSAFIPYSDQANTHDQEGPEIAALAGGGFAVGWTIQNGGSSGSEDSYVRVFDNAGTAVSSSTLVTDSAGSSQRQNAMGAIYPLAGGGFIVRVNRDDRDPNPDGAEDDLILQFFESPAPVSPNNAPTDIALSATSINESATSTNATVGTLSTTDADGGDTHTYSLVAGTGDTNNGSFNISGTTLRTASALAAGSYSIRINTNDGTDDYAEVFSIMIVDNVAPSAPSTPDLAIGSDAGISQTDNLTTGTQPIFEGTAESGALIKLFDTDGTTQIGSGTATGGTWSIQTSVLTEGPHTVTATATDGAGNVSPASAGLTITLDNTAPVITSSLSPSLTYGTSGGYSLTASGSPVSFIALAGLPAGVTMNPATGAFSGAPTTVGTTPHPYTVSDAAGNAAVGLLAITVNPAPLTIVGLTGDNKVYDGTTAGTASGTANLSGIIGADDVSLGGSPVFSFASANVGTGITLNTSGYTLSGTQSGNYTLTQPTLSGDITAAGLTIVGLTGDNKVYDDTTAGSASGTATLSGIIGADDVSLGGSPVFTFASANVGTGITVNTTGYTISGTDSGNYALTQPTLAADITAKGLTISGLTGDNKGYDGTTAGTASGTANLVGVETGDDVSLGGSPVFTFASANLGTGITLSTSGYVLTGTDSGNYTLTQPTLSGDITVAELTLVGLTGDNKVYDGTTAGTASGTATLSGIIGADDVILGGSPVFSFASANAGTGITINTSGYTISGTNSGNYTLTQPTLSGDITAAGLTIVGLTGDDKVYDDTTAGSASGTATLSGIIGADDVSLGGSPVFTFASANVGTGITVNATGYTISGTDSGNYTLTQPTLAADITAKGLTITGLTGDNKGYDGTTAGSASGTATLVGLETGDDVILGGSPAFTFASANLGTGITLNTSGYVLTGTDSGNYTLTQPTLFGDITAAELTLVGLTGDNKVYDGTTAGTASGTATLSGIIGADDVILGGSPVFSFASANVGTGITINTSGYTISGTNSGNYTLTQPTLSGDITAAGLTIVGLTGDDKVYDDTTAGTASGTATLSGIIGADDVSLGGSPVFTFASANVGTGITVNATGYTISGTDSGNYTLTQPTLSADITAKGLTISGLTGDNKTYDGTTAGTATGTANLVGVETGDDVSLGGSSVFTFASSNVGTGITLNTTGYTLSGTDSGNYTLSQPTGLSADITPLALTVTGVTAANKTYDATTDAPPNASGLALIGVVSGDTVTPDTTGLAGTFADKNVGTGKAVTITGIALQGADAGNYSVTQPTGITADITAASLTLTGATADNKVYDTTTDATLSGSPTPVGVLLSDSVAIDTSAATGAFADKSIGTSKPVTASGYALSGTDAGNYTLTQPTGLSADITPAALTITGVTADNKVYDATTTATLGGAPTPVGVLLSDTVSIDSSGAAATFADKVVGTSKPVTATGYALSGADAGNYTVSQPTGITADITPASLTISGATANNKVYDATTDATLSGSPTPVGVLLSDAVTIDSSSATGAFGDKNVGTGKAISATGYALSGADAGNYTLTQPTGITADITPAGLTVADAAADNKIYDGTTDATPVLTAASLTGIQGSDTVAIDDGSVLAAFEDALVGTDKNVAITGLALSGTDAGNYTLAQPTVLADITALELTITGTTAANKTYDATTDATIDTTSSTLVGVLGSDDVLLEAFSAIGTFDDKNVGTGKTVTTTGFLLIGSDTGNYSLTQPTTTADITAATLTSSGTTASDKVYDNNTDAIIDTASAILDNVISGDVVTLDTASAVGTFDTELIGTDKTVTITGLALTGTDASNYTLTDPTTLADITAKDLIVLDAMANSKVYDDSVLATLDLSLASLSGVETGDTVTLDTTGATGAFVDANIGTSKTVNVSGLALTGADAGNYTLTQPSTLADITAREITLTGLVALDKVYDATTDATLDDASLVLVGVQGDDVLTIDNSGSAATFADKNVGTDKAVTLTGAILAGAQAGNYTLTLPTDLMADITAAELTVADASVTTRAYDGTTTAPLDFSGASLVGIQGSDTVALESGSAAGTYADADVATAKAVTYSGLSLSGTDAGNYTLTDPTLTGDITAVLITVSAQNVARPFGDPNPDLVATYSGFVNSEDESVFTGAPVLSTDALRTSPVGTGYVITVTTGTLAATNYTFTAVDATFEVEPGFHFADTNRNLSIELDELLRFIQLYNTREGTRRTGAYQSNDATVDRYEPGGGTRILPHTADTNDDGLISLVELTRIIELYNTRSGTVRTGAYRYEPQSEDGFTPVLNLNN